MIDLDATLAGPTLDVWGRPVSYLPVISQPGVAAFAITGVFDRAADVILTEMRASEMNQAGVSSTAPMLTVRLADFGANPPRQADRVTVAGETFVVWDIQTDGWGMADLLLRKF